MEDLKDIVYSIASGFEKRNLRKLRKINDHLLGKVLVEFSKINYELAVISYVLSKIVSKPRFLDNEKGLEEIESNIKNLGRWMGKNNYEQIEAALKILYKSIHDLEKEDPRFIIDLVSKGKLKAAATMYAQGISLGVAAEMTGMEKQEILDYAGKTMMFDRVKDEVTIKDRLKTARRLIGRE